MRGRAGRVVRVEHCLDRVLADHRLGKRRLDALAGPIGEVLIDQLRRVGAAGAAQIAAVEPFADDALQLVEEVELGVIAGITELPEQQLRKIG